MSDQPDCSDIEDRKLDRPRYFEGRLLTADDLRAEQEYLLDRLRAHNRLHGWGTVCGLEVEPTRPPSASIVVEPGLALDRLGREIILTEAVLVDLSPWRAGEARLVDVTACYREEPTGWVPAVAGASDEAEPSAIREGAQIQISESGGEPGTALSACVHLATVSIVGGRQIEEADIDNGVRHTVEGPPSHRPRPKLRVVVDGTTWEETDDLATSGPRDLHYQVRHDPGDATTIRFGDGKRGARPRRGSIEVTFYHRGD
jgi:hypothetical protein